MNLVIIYDQVMEGAFDNKEVTVISLYSFLIDLVYLEPSVL